MSSYLPDGHTVRPAADGELEAATEVVAAVHPRAFGRGLYEKALT